MSLLAPSPEISSLAGRETPARASPRISIRNVGFPVNDLEKVDLKCRNSVWWSYGQVELQSGTTPFGSRKVKDEEEKREYHVNTGYAIRTLRQEFPELFYRELSFDIYRDDIVFKDPLNAFAGIGNYKSIFWALRFHGKLFFRALQVDIIGVWQPMDDMIMVRWTVHGIPCVLFEGRSRFDGTSEYKLDKHGKIYEHKVHNIAVNGPKKFQALAVEQLIQSLACPSTPKPT